MKLNYAKPRFSLTGAVLLACCAVLPARADYSSTVVSQAPVGYWRLNETVAPPPSIAATNLGSVGAAGNGSYSSGVVRGRPGAIAGDADVAAGFINNAYMRVPYTASLNPNAPYTVEFWAKPDSIGVFACPVSSTDFSVTPRLGWLFYQDNSSVAVQDGWVFRAYSSAGNGQIASPAGTVTTNWQHIVGVVDPVNNLETLYVNGQPMASRAWGGATTTPNPQQPLSIGIRYDNGFGFNGSLDEVAIYATALSSARVLAHYSAGTNPAPVTSYVQQVMNDAPIGYWRLDQLEGPPAANLGTFGAAATGSYFYNAQPGQAGPTPPPYNGFDGANKAVAFDTTGGSVKIPALNLNTNTVTITAWLKPNGAQPINAGIIFSRAGNTVAGLKIDGFGGTGPGLGYNWNNDAASTSWYPTTDAGLPALTDGAWNFVALVIQPSQASIYIANTPSASAFASATNAVASPVQAFEGPLLIGQDAGTTNNFIGTIDEVAVFNRSLGAGEIYSEFADSIGNVAAKIFSDPQSPTNQLFVGDTLTLAVDAGGSSPMTFQWRKDGSPISGATQAVYSKPGVALTDSGNYDVLVQAGVGSQLTSQPANVVINPVNMPAISQGPLGRTLYPGGTLTLSVAATGGGLSYYWTLNGSLVLSGSSSTYHIASVTTNNGGAYAVVVSNIVGTATAGPVTVNVVTVAPGTYAAAVVGDGPEAWYRLDEAPGSTIMFDAMGRHDGTYVGSPTLGAPGVGTDLAVTFDGSAGSYGVVPFTPALNKEDFTLECWAKTTALSGTLCPVSSRVNTKGEWFWTGVPNNGVWAGGVADSANNFYVPSTVAGATILSNQWTHLVMSYGSTSNGSLRVYFNGQWDGAGYVDFSRNATGPLIIGARGETYDGTTGASTVSESFIGQVDEVVYYDHALSPAEILNHYQAALYGNNTKPVFRIQPQSAVVVAGAPVTFTAYVEGTLPITNQWTKNGAPIPNATNVTFTIAATSFADAGTYQLVASNPAGSSNSAPAVLTVDPVPAYANATNGLVLHLRFDGDYQDTSGRGNNGTPSGTDTPTFVTGKIGSGALHYFTQTDTGGNGTVTNTAYVTLGMPTDLEMDAGTSFSVSYWVRLPTNYLHGDLPFLSSATNSYGNWGMTFAPSYQLGGWSWSLRSDPSSTGANYGLYGPNNSINNGQWHHLAHTFDRAAALGITYLDGVKVDSTSIVGLGDLTNPYPFNIGQDPTGQYPEAGSADLDDLGVWRRVLTPLEAYGIYYAGQNGHSFDTYGPVTVYINQSGGNLVISWQGGTLLEATSLSGPWTPVAGATPPNYTVTPGPGNKFYKVQL